MNAWQRWPAGAQGGDGPGGVRPSRRAAPSRSCRAHRGQRRRRAARRGRTAARSAGRHDAAVHPGAGCRRSRRGGAAAARARHRGGELRPVAGDGGAERRAGGGGGRGVPAVRAWQLRSGGGEPVAALGQRPARRADPVASRAASGRAAAGEPAGARHAGGTAPGADRGRGRTDRRRRAARVAVRRSARLRRAAAARRVRAAGRGRGGATAALRRSASRCCAICARPGKRMRCASATAACRRGSCFRQRWRGCRDGTAVSRRHCGWPA